jgi:hypothetical protein
MPLMLHVFYILQEVQAHSDSLRPSNPFDDTNNIGKSDFLARHRLFQVDFYGDYTYIIPALGLTNGPRFRRF